MSTFDLIVVLGAMCGVFMVLGGLWLFYKGIVTLQEVSDKPDAVTLEFKNVLKIQSRYPAYGFFAFGLAFIALAAVYGRPDPIPTITLTGAVENVVDPHATRVRVLLALWDTDLNDDGKLKRDLYPTLKQLHIEIQSPGNDPSSFNFDVDTSESGRDRVANFAPVKLKKVGEQPPAGPIETVPPGVTLAPLDAATGFKEAPQ
jgi:hypothetical protein